MNWTFSAVLYLYFIFVGACYFLGFWTPLHFNIFEFLSPMDILKSATYPLIPAALGIFFFVLIDAVNSSNNSIKTDDSDPKSIKALYWLAIFILFLMIVMNLIRVAVHIFNAIISEPEKRLSYALPAISIIAAIYLVINPPLLKDKAKFIRNFVIIFACFLPTVSYFQGEKNITNKMEATSSFFYLKKSSKNCTVAKESKEIYLGFYGGMYIFMNSINKDICIEKDGGVLLSYYKFMKKEETEVGEKPTNKKINKD
tara:strand:- start:103 stop:870 length:768 start_codon:yes stop_codon:yes gene_type:complete